MFFICKLRIQGQNNACLNHLEQTATDFKFRFKNLEKNIKGGHKCSLYNHLLGKISKLTQLIKL